MGHEYKREGTFEDYNSIDSITYLLSEFLKYTKYGHTSTTQMASRWIRYGMATRDEMISTVKKYDKILDQGIVDGFCSFTNISIRKFYEILLACNLIMFTDVFNVDDGIQWRPFR